MRARRPSAGTGTAATVAKQLRTEGAIRDAEQQRIGAEAALAYVKAQALDPVKAVTEGPMVARLLVAHWCDKAISTGRSDRG